MLKPLNEQQETWVNDTFRSMTIDEKIGHLLMPFAKKPFEENDGELFERIPIGSFFMLPGNSEEIDTTIRQFQRTSRIPLLIAGDMEQGAAALRDEAAIFPPFMGAAAAGSVDLVYKMGKATAIESRCRGFHWTFSPVVDINYNFNNPVTNIRAFGDDPKTVNKFLVPYIQGIQEDGLMAATAKHFPGDGMDDRDQHLCTSVNNLSFDEWKRTYGTVWKNAIDAPVLSIMPGHISLPDYQGFRNDPEEAMPATLSYSLMTKLLRQELDFQGVIVSDAVPMIGLASRVHENDAVVDFINAGGDVFLFADPVKDFQRLKDALMQERLTERRIDESVIRVLQLKARLGVHQDAFGCFPSEGERATYKSWAQEMADTSITLVREPKRMPSLGKGSKVLTITIREESSSRLPLELEVFDQELMDRGILVDHLRNPGHNEVIEIADDYDAIFYNFHIIPHIVIGNNRLCGKLAMTSWRDFSFGRDNVYFTSFGSPYVIWEKPHMSNFATTYGGVPVCQRSAVKAWLGEIAFQGSLPVKLPKVRIIDEIKT